MHISLLVLSLCVLGCQSAFFRLYTREGSQSDEYRITKNLDSLRASNFDGRRKTVIVIHGYLENGLVTWVSRLRYALLKHENINVITTDWSDKTWYKDYITAFSGTRPAGLQVGDLIKFLITNAPSSEKLFHVVGFSLGAHAAGFAGQHLQKKYGIKLDRITGLDPAGPLFWHDNFDKRLDPSDADFVDVIHTDGGTFGLTRAAGHIDFYPNGGKDQPNCPYQTDLSWISCNHMRCPDLFIESVTQSPIRAYPCSRLDDFDRGRCSQCSGGQCPSMGYNADRTRGRTSGKHFLYTNKSPPYIAYHYQVSFKTGSRWWAGIWDWTKIIVKITGTKGDTGNVALKSRNVDAKSTETFVMPSPRDVGELRRIDIKLVWQMGDDKWDLVSVVARPAWSNQQYTACYNTWVKKSTITRSFSTGHVSC